MLSFHELMAYLGVKVPDLFAGLAGGVVKALVFHRDKPGETIISGIVGALMANYLGEGVAEKIGFGRGAVCFAVGISAMVICQAIIDRVKTMSEKGRA